MNNARSLTLIEQKVLRAAAAGRLVGYPAGTQYARYDIAAGPGIYRAAPFGVPDDLTKRGLLTEVDFTKSYTTIDMTDQGRSALDALTASKSVVTTSEFKVALTPTQAAVIVGINTATVEWHAGFGMAIPSGFYWSTDERRRIPERTLDNLQKRGLIEIGQRPAESSFTPAVQTISLTARGEEVAAALNQQQRLTETNRRSDFHIDF